MPRGRSISRKKTSPDQVFNDPRITKFINHVMMNGKQDQAQRIVYIALQKAGEKLNATPMTVFEKSLDAVRPEQEVKSRRVGGANYQIPIPVTRTRGDFLAMTWIIKASRGRSGKPMSEKLTEELVNAYKQEGEAVKKKENTHKMAEANKAFSHFKW